MKEMSFPAGVRTIRRNRRGPMSRQRRSSRRTTSNRGYSSGYTTSTHSDADDKETMIESVLGQRNSGIHQRRRNYAPLKGDALINDEFRQTPESFPSPSSIFKVPVAVSGGNEWIWRLCCVFFGSLLYLSFANFIDWSPRRGAFGPSSEDVQKMLYSLEKESLKDPIVQREENRFGGPESPASLRGYSGKAVNVNFSNNDDMVYSEQKESLGSNTLGAGNVDDYVDPYATKKRPVPEGSYVMREHVDANTQPGQSQNAGVENIEKPQINENVQTVNQARLTNTSLVPPKYSISNATRTANLGNNTQILHAAEEEIDTVIAIDKQNATKINSTETAIADQNATKAGGTSTLIENTSPKVAKQVVDSTITTDTKILDTKATIPEQNSTKVGDVNTVTEKIIPGKVKQAVNSISTTDTSNIARIQDIVQQNATEAVDASPLIENKHPKAMQETVNSISPTDKNNTVTKQNTTEA